MTVLRRVLAVLKRVGLAWLMAVGVLTHIVYLRLYLPSVEVRPQCSVEWLKSRASPLPKWVNWNGEYFEVQGRMAEAYVEALMEELRYYGLFPFRFGHTIWVASTDDLKNFTIANYHALYVVARAATPPAHIRERISSFELRSWLMYDDCEIVRALAIDPAEWMP